MAVRQREAEGNVPEYVNKAVGKLTEFFGKNL